MRAGTRLLAVTAVAALATATAGAGVVARSGANPGINTTQANPSPPHPDVGLICVWAIYAALAEIGRRCDVPPHPRALAETERAVARMEAYARMRSPDRAAWMARYKQDAIIGDPQLCSSDMADAFRRPVRDDNAAIVQARSEIDALLARSPPVEWGNTCL